MVELNSEQLVFVFGPCPAAAHEMEMVRTSGLLQLLPPNGKVVADGGFRGEAAIVHPFRAAEPGPRGAQRTNKTNRVET